MRATLTLLKRAQEAFEYGEIEVASDLVFKTLEKTQAQLRSFEHCELHILQGKILRHRGSYLESLKHFEQCLSIAQEAGNVNFELDSLNNIASLKVTKADYEGALAVLRRALDIANGEKLFEKRAGILTNMGAIFVNTSRLEPAISSLTEAYALYETLDIGHRDSAVNMMYLGRVYQVSGQHLKAQEFYIRAIDLAVLLGNQTFEAAIRNNLGSSYLEDKLWDLAQTQYEIALKIARNTNNQKLVTDNLEWLGKVLLYQGKHVEAAKIHNECLLTSKLTQDLRGMMVALFHLGEDHLLSGELDLAKEYACQALELAKQIDNRQMLSQIHELLSKICNECHDYREAYEHVVKYHQLDKTLLTANMEEKNQELIIQFDLERAQNEAATALTQKELEHQARQQAEYMVRERTGELEATQVEVVTRLAIAAEYRDDDTGEHTRRVGRSAALMAYVLGWRIGQVELLFTAARLHDVGKIGIPDSILLKPGRLTDEEFELMRSHASIGAHILANGHSRLLRLAEEIALNHHERWDGFGYPNKISSEDIPQSARIVSVADVLDALIHERPYKKAWTVEATLAEIEKNSGSQFDPDVVSACLFLFGGEGYFSPKDSCNSWEGLFEEIQGLPRFKDGLVPVTG